MHAAFRTALVALAVSATSPAYGQTQAQQDRLNHVAQFVVTAAPMCKKLGMKLAADLPEKAEAALHAETTA